MSNKTYILTASPPKILKKLPYPALEKSRLGKVEELALYPIFVLTA